MKTITGLKSVYQVVGTLALFLGMERLLTIKR